MKVRDIIRSLRQLVLEHPHAADLDVVLAPHGHGHRQPLDQIHLNTHETLIILEAEK
jgi:hypothetical protein